MIQLDSCVLLFVHAPVPENQLFESEIVVVDALGSLLVFALPYSVERIFLEFDVVLGHGFEVVAFDRQTFSSARHTLLLEESLPPPEQIRRLFVD